MIVLGLTGGIAMGKSTVTKMIKNIGFEVFDADAEVHKLYDYCDEVLQFCRDRIPESYDGNINRKIVSDKVFADPALLAELTVVINYHLDIAVATFIAEQRWRTDNKVCVLDAPLLFEGGWDKLCDRVMTISCSDEVQKARALARGMSEEKLDSIKVHQFTDEQRRARADYIIDSNLTIKHVEHQLVELFEHLIDDDTNSDIPEE